MKLRQIVACQRGATAVEFALVAPAFLLLLLGIMDYCRYAWTVQSLNSVAYSTARCATYSSSCASASQIQAYAVSVGTNQGIPISAANVTYTANSTCNGNSSQNKVTVSYAYDSPLSKFVSLIPGTLTGTGCFTYFSPAS